jgi:hypothetical protein
VTAARRIKARNDPERLRRWCDHEGLGTKGFQGYILKQKFGLGGGWSLFIVFAFLVVVLREGREKLL